jgi:hypothetical protein
MDIKTIDIKTIDIKTIDIKTIDIKTIDIKTMVNEMITPNNKKNICKQENELLRKCILCKYYLSSNEWGTTTRTLVIKW